MILNYFIKTELITASFINADNKLHEVSFRYSYPSDSEEIATQDDAIISQVTDVLTDYCFDNQIKVKVKEITEIQRVEIQTTFKEFLTGINFAIVDTLESIVSNFRV